jgi:hypothetical protein
MQLTKELRKELISVLTKLIIDLDYSKGVFIRTKNKPEYRQTSFQRETEIYFLEEKINTITTALIENNLSYELEQKIKSIDTALIDNQINY